MSIALTYGKIGKGLVNNNNGSELPCYGSDPLEDNSYFEEDLTDKCLVADPEASSYDVGGFTGTTGVVAAMMWVKNDGSNDENTTLYIKLFKGDNELKSFSTGVGIEPDGVGYAYNRFILEDGLTENGDDYSIKFYHLGTLLESRSFSITGAEADIKVQEFTVGSRLNNQHSGDILQVSYKDWYIPLYDIFDGGLYMDEPVIADGGSSVDVSNYFYKTFVFAIAILRKNDGSGTGYKDYTLEVKDPDDIIIYSWSDTVGVGGGGGSSSVDGFYLDDNINKNGTYTVTIKGPGGDIEGQGSFDISGITNQLDILPTGNIWVEGENIAFIDNKGYKHIITNDGSSDTVPSGKEGYVWIDTVDEGQLLYISESGVKRKTVRGIEIDSIDTSYKGYTWINNDDNQCTVFSNSNFQNCSNKPYDGMLMFVTNNGNVYGLLNGNN